MVNTSLLHMRCICTLHIILYVTPQRRVYALYIHYIRYIALHPTHMYSLHDAGTPIGIGGRRPADGDGRVRRRWLGLARRIGWQEVRITTCIRYTSLHRPKYHTCITHYVTPPPHIRYVYVAPHAYPPAPHIFSYTSSHRPNYHTGGTY